MLIAGIAFLEAFGACLGALVEAFGMFGMGLIGRRPASGKCSQARRASSQDYQNFSTIHNGSPCLKK
jgi:hypothetical protein